jgi:hypothetical protein
MGNIDMLQDVLSKSGSVKIPANNKLVIKVLDIQIPFNK